MSVMTYIEKWRPWQKLSLLSTLPLILSAAWFFCASFSEPQRLRLKLDRVAGKPAEVCSYSVSRITGTDALGRRIMTGSKRKSGEKYVGMFYFTWLGQHPSGQKGVFDITKLRQKSPQDLFDKKGTPESPLGQYHFWGEPLFGYYDSSDPWIIMRHMELLTMAGIDYLILDATNNFYYPEVVTRLLNQLQILQKQGWNVPKVAFYTNSSSGITVQNIYNHFYKNDNYSDVWFKPKGKPMIIGITANNKHASDQTIGGGFKEYVSDELTRFFDVRESQWPTGVFNRNAFPWISWEYPQRLHNDVVSVSIAQHSPVNIVFSDTVNTRGRGYNGHVKKNDKNGVNNGLNFQNQWETVFANDKKISNVFVTGWNEWIAIKNADAQKVFFVDGFNQEFSRDIEMMKGGHADNYYLQLIGNVKRYKYDPEIKGKTVLQTMDVFNDDLTQWNAVNAHYKDFEGDAMPRHYKDFSGTGWYTDATNRNDITDIKVTNDKKNVYLLIQTKDPVIKYKEKELNWMNVFIGTADQSAGFSGFNYVINRFPDQNKKTSIEKSTGGYQWKGVGTAQYHLSGNALQISIPLKALGQKAGNISLNFKVADHVTKYDDIMDYYVSGDSAPIGRLGFFYNN